MNCSPKLEGWISPDIYVWNPKHREGSFYHLCSGAFVVDSETAEKLGDLLELAVELLPLSHKGKKYYLMNVLECANCLDERSTQWKFDKETRVPIRILKYEFRSDRFPESTFFKIDASARASEGASPFMCARQAVLPTPSKPPHPTQLLSRRQIAPLTSLAATLTGLPESVGLC
jgi:hypothetical protein